MNYEPLYYQYEHDSILPWRLKKIRLEAKQKRQIEQIAGTDYHSDLEYMMSNVNIARVSDTVWPYTVGWIELFEHDIDLERLKIPGHHVLLAHRSATARIYPVTTARRPTSIVMCAATDDREIATLLKLAIDTVD